MIPKRIHYCWLSEEPFPYELQSCIDSWKRVMPDYELVLWDTKRFKINSVKFVEDACKAKKWAFAADYIRVYALYNEGGVYMDVDVFVKKKFDEFLTSDFFTAMEYHPLIVKDSNTEKLLNKDGTSRSTLNKPGIGIQAAILGAIKGHPFLKDCLDHYEKKLFVEPNGKSYNDFIAPGIFAMIAEKYGFRYLDERQLLNHNMLILPSNIFSSEIKKTSYAVHNCYGSWKDRPKISVVRRIINKLFSRGELHTEII
jgi:hypothetical protein